MNTNAQQSSLIEKAASALNEGQLDRAEQMVQECRNLGGGTMPAPGWWISGLLRSRQGRYPEALTFLEPLTRLAQWESFTPLFRELYIVAFHAGEMDKAIAAGEHAIHLDPGDLVLQNEVWLRKILRGLPKTTRIDQLTAFLPALEDQAIRTDCPVLYRLSALVLATNDQRERALAVYLPLLDWAIRRAEQRQAWYGYSVVTNTEDSASQSQRFGATEAQIDDEFREIEERLQLRPTDRVADIGGAGGLLTRRIAAVVDGVVLTDVSQDLVDIATRNLCDISNIDCVCHDITVAPLAEQVDKLLMSFVTPCFSNFAAFEMALRNMFSALTDKGRAFISNNYDILSARNAAENALTPENAIAAYSTLHIYENVLWLDIPAVEQTASAIGFSECSIVNRRPLPDGRVMFDFVLVK